MTSPVPHVTPATIAPVEPVVTAAAEPDPERFERAGVISDRLVDNIETVVYGKRSEIKLVLTALACDGHVLLEDVPGTAKAYEYYLRGNQLSYDSKRAIESS